jgi:hypothetical protein
MAVRFLKGARDPEARTIERCLHAFDPSAQVVIRKDESGWRVVSAVRVLWPDAREAVTAALRASGIRVFD